MIPRSNMEICTYMGRHKEIEHGFVCYLTGEYCIGIGVDKNEKPLTFSQTLMARCPMYNIEIRRLFRRSVSDQIRQRNAEIRVQEEQERVESPRQYENCKEEK